MGRYELVERLAVGGMAEVFLARERGGLDREVVVKRMLPALAEDPSFVEMFLQEARIAAGISHPNVVQILELGEADGWPFIAMEYVAGVCLKDLIKSAKSGGGSIPLGVVGHLVAQACAGAQAAHDLLLPDGTPAELVHRDLTPHNLMVDAAGHVKLLDFGIAKASGISGDFTRTGVLRGKISYMSPEQARQEPLDRRSDVFALGVCAYELFSLERPFTGNTELQTLQRILTGQYQPLRDRRPDIPLGVATAVHHAMASPLADRFPTADAFRLALRQEAEDAGIDLDPDRAATWLKSALGAIRGPRRPGPRSRTGDLLVSLGGGTPVSRATDSTTVAPAVPPTAPPAATRARPSSVAPVLVAGALALAAALTVLAALVVAGASYWTSGPSGPVLRMTLAPVQASETLLEDLEPIARYLERRLDRPIALDVGASYEDTAAQVARGDVPFGVLPGSIAAATAAAHPDVQILAYKVTDGSASTQGYLVASLAESATTLADLKGRTICLVDPDSLTGWKLPSEYAAAQGMDLQRDFVVRRSGNHEQVLRDLVDGKCAVGATFSTNFLSADQRGIRVASLKILAVTGTTPNDAVIGGPGATEAERDALTAALLDFEPMRDAGTARVGESEHITGFAAP